jgi:hypothetical protein
MTRKDYVRFAMMLKNQRIIFNGDKDTIYHIAYATAYIFEQDNERFDRAKFLKACGVES